MNPVQPVARNKELKIENCVRDVIVGNTYTQCVHKVSANSLPVCEVTNNWRRQSAIERTKTLGLGVSKWSKWSWGGGGGGEQERVTMD